MIVQSCRWLQTQIMHQNLAVILRQLCYSKISFIVLVPDVHSGSVPADEDPERGQVVLLNFARIRFFGVTVNLQSNG